MNTYSSNFQDAIETVEKLPPEDQMMLVEIIGQRLIEIRRKNRVTEVSEARQAYQVGDIHRGTVEDLIQELDS
jgi:hypothetical protein